MAVRSVSSESISGYSNGSGNTNDYKRQTTVHDAGWPALHRESRARALVRRPSVDFAKLTKQRSRAIIDNYFKASTSPPVLEHMSKEILKKISDTEMGKVDIREAKRQLTDRKIRLNAEVKRKVARFPSELGRKKRAHRNTFKPAVDDLTEVQSTVDYSIDSTHSTANDVPSATVHMTTTTNKSAYHTRRKPKPDTPTNPFDQAFAEAEIDSPCRAKLKAYQSNKQSHNDTLEMTFHTQEVLRSSKLEMKKEDETTSEVQNSMLLSMAELSTAQHNNDDEVDFAMSETVSTSVEQTEDDNDILNRAQDITLSNASEIIRNTCELEDVGGSERLSNGMSTEESVMVTTSNSMRPSNTSVDSLHLNLSCEHNGESKDECPTDEDDEEPRSKLPVAETPLDVDGPLPSKFHDIPQFSEVQQFLGRIPTFAEYMAYRLDKISMDLECRYPDLDKHIQQIISTLGNTLTYELFQRAALNVQSQAKQMYEGLFMVLRFGRQLFQNFPENASYFTTQWVNEYIIHQGGWDAVTDRYFEEQLTVMSPVTTAEMTGALGESGDGGLQMESTDGGALTYVVKSNASTTSCPASKKSVNMSPPVWDIMQHPMFNLERAYSVEFLPEVAPDPGIVSSPPPDEADAVPHVVLASQFTTDSATKSLNSLKSLDHDYGHIGGTTPALSRTLYPIRRTNSAPELSNILSTSSRSSSPYSDMEGPPPELLERRRGSLMDYNDVFLNYLPFFPVAIPSAAIAIHVALDLAHRLSSS